MKEEKKDERVKWFSDEKGRDELRENERIKNEGSNYEMNINKKKEMEKYECK